MSRFSAILSIMALLFVMGSHTNAEGFRFRRMRRMNRRAFAEKAVEGVPYSLDIDGEHRSYIVYKPASARGGDLPLMIVLHGGMGNARFIERKTGFNRVADRGGFIVAYPNGTLIAGGMRGDRRTWNAGNCCGVAAREDVNDVAFIAKMIRDIASRYPVNLRRVYVAGFSNGAMLAYRLACQIPERIAAIISVSGALVINNCEVGRNVAVLAIHGTADDHVPFRGGQGPNVRVVFDPVRKTIKRITRPRDCGAPTEIDLNRNVRVFSYHCRDGAPVELYVIKGGGHVWPGGWQRNMEEPDTGGISASRIAWDFAKRFSR